ncbi:hypothetical protein [Treponema sp. R80B11-R83G3]
MSNKSSENKTGTPSYEWDISGTKIAGEQTYTIPRADLGKTIKVTVSYSDNSGSITSTQTSAVSYKNLNVDDGNYINLAGENEFASEIWIENQTSRSDIEIEENPKGYIVIINVLFTRKDPSEVIALKSCSYIKMCLTETDKAPEIINGGIVMYFNVLEFDTKSGPPRNIYVNGIYTAKETFVLEHNNP